MYRIENRSGDDHIVSLKDKFTLRVIAPEKRAKHPNYPANKVVAAIFENNDEIPAWAKEFNLGDLEGWKFGETNGWDFEGVDVLFYDEDMPNCNKQKWIDAANFYCLQKIDKAVVTVTPYNYVHEVSRLDTDLYQNDN